jgi:hypothetical protein
VLVDFGDTYKSKCFQIVETNPEREAHDTTL